jgi:hypothetical protein
VRRFASLLAAVAVGGFAAVASPVPRASASEVAGYGMSALAVGVRYKLDSPGFLPTGDPAEGNIMDFDVPIARTGVSQGPVINALGSPFYPGDTAAHLGTALKVLAPPQFPPLPNDPILAESNYPPTPDKGSSTSFSQAGVGECKSDASANGAKVYATTLAQSIPGVVDVASSVTRNDVAIAADSVRSTATSSTGTINIAGVITIDGITGTAEATSNGAAAKPTANLNIGKVTVAGQAAYIDDSGVHVVGSGGGEGVVPQTQQMVNALLATDGLTVRTISPKTTIDGAAATSSAGALAISIDRLIPAIGVPGVPALEIPGAAPVILGTPDLPVHIDVLIGEARVSVAATQIPSFDIGLTAPTLPDLSGPTSVSADQFSSVSGPGASVDAALSAPPAPAESGGAELAIRPTSDQARGKGIPIGWVIVGVFGAFALSGPLLGYARWQLLEGRGK